MPKRSRPTLRRRTRATKRVKRVVRRRRTFKIRGTHKFSRYTPQVSYSVPALATELDVGFHFTLDEIINVNEFTVLFDRYKIDYVVCKFQLITNPDAAYLPNSVIANSNNFYPKLWWYVDPDDANPLTLAQIKERQNVKCRVMRPNQVISVRVKPAVLLQTYRTALTTGYAPKYNTFIDCGTVDVPHYALKFVLDTNGVAAAAIGMAMRIEKRYFFTMKDVR